MKMETAGMTAAQKAQLRRDGREAAAAELAPRVVPSRDAGGRWLGTWSVPSRSGGEDHEVKSHGAGVERWALWRCDCEYAKHHVPRSDGSDACAHVLAVLEFWRRAEANKLLDTYSPWLVQVGEVVARGSTPFVWVRPSGEVTKLTDCGKDDRALALRLVHLYTARGPEHGRQVLALRALLELMPSDRKPWAEQA